MLQQTLAPLTTLGQTIPSSIYEDPYVLGYLNAISAFAIEMTSKGNLSRDDKGRVAIDALRAVAGMNVRAAVENSIRFINEHNVQFENGGAQANKVINVTYGWLRPEQDDEVAEVFEALSRQNTESDSIQASAAALLGQIYFYQYVEDNHRISRE